MGGQIQNLLNENFFKTQKNFLSNFQLNLLSSFEYTNKRTDILLLLRKKNINHKDWMYLILIIEWIFISILLFVVILLQTNFIGNYNIEQHLPRFCITVQPPPSTCIYTRSLDLRVQHWASPPKRILDRPIFKIPFDSENLRKFMTSD